MNREDKINALRQVLKGKPIEKAFPVLHVCTMATGNEKGFLVMVGNLFKCIPEEQVPGFIEKLKSDNPYSIVEVVHIPKDEYDRLNEELENEY